MNRLYAWDLDIENNCILCGLDCEFKITYSSFAIIHLRFGLLSCLGCIFHPLLLFRLILYL